MIDQSVLERDTRSGTVGSSMRMAVVVLAVLAGLAGRGAMADDRAQTPSSSPPAAADAGGSEAAPAEPRDRPEASERKMPDRQLMPGPGCPARQNKLELIV